MRSPSARHWPAVDLFWYVCARAICFATLLFLVLPLFIIVPISFTSGNLLAFPLPGFSTRWYDSIVSREIWRTAFINSLFVGLIATALATALGTLAAIGLSRSRAAIRNLVLAFIISPLLIPIVVVALGMYFFFAAFGLVNTFAGLILAHTALGVPFVVITVMAAFTGFDENLTRAAATLGASPGVAFRRVTLPIIWPGVASGGLFAFVTSFDEIVVALFVAGPTQRTLPRQIFSGVREYVSPEIAAVATLLILFSSALLVAVQILQRRGRRLAGRGAPS